MPRFLYKAIDGSGQVRRGEAEAADEAELVRRIQARGEMLLQADGPGWRAAGAALLGADLGGRRGLGTRAVGRLTRELAVMLQSGQDLDHALRYMVETAPDARSRALLGELRDRVRDGKSLGHALAAYPETFSRLYVGLVVAGEAGGALADALSRLAEMLERDQKLTTSIRSALAYPTMLVLAAIGSIVLLLTWVLPQFTPMFAQAGAKLPLATRTIIALGDAIRDDGVWLVMALGTAIGITATAARRPATRRRIDALVLRLPIAGPLVRHVNAARLTRTLGTLLANRVGLLAALSITRQVLANTVAAEAVERATARAREGESIARALVEGDAFRPETIHLLKLGAETGRLAEMALHAAALHEESVRTGVQQLVELMVPAITIAMGAIVAAIIGSLLVAMMSLNDLAI